MPMHRAVPGAAEHPQGVAGRPRPDFAPRGIGRPPRGSRTQMPRAAYFSTD